MIGYETIAQVGPNLRLKVPKLKQAVDKANNFLDRKQVTIPLFGHGEVQGFGAYAVPRITTHIFVGPFSVKMLET